tara:strand:- start:804 stop:965 length:162 start_codon:yes stop_codon:yes gene_type:complete
MDKIHEVLDDLVDNCFADEDLLSTSGVDNSLDLELEGKPKTCLVSLMYEPKVA